MRSIALVVALTATSFADAPPKAKPLSAADQKQYNDVLKKGRTLQGKKDFKGAIAAFQACVKIAPGDGTCLGELGWTAYLAKDLVLAESATKDALKATGSPALRGATLYNFALIQEAKGDKPAAMLAYSGSLAVRPNGVVRAALAKLSPDAAAAFDPFKPVALAGPFTSADGYCKTLPKQTEEEYDCSCGVDDTKAAKRALPPGVLQVETVTHGCTAHATEAGLIDYTVAVKVGSSWYGRTVASVHQNRFCTDTMVLKSVTSTPGKAAALEYAITGECAGGNGGDQWTQQALVVVGGAKPSATPQIFVTRHETESDEPYDANKVSKVTADTKLDVKWGDDGSITLSGKTKGLDSSEASNTLGKHALVFP